MTGVASKNLYELLGNDPDQDPELRTPDVPVAPIDKPAARSGKRNAPAEAPVSAPAPAGGDRADRGDRGGRGRGRGGRGGRGGRDGNDQAFSDRDAGRNHNRERPTEDGSERRGGRVNRGRGYDGRQHRGGPGGVEGRSSRRGLDDRHSRSVHSGPNDQAKQAEKGWGEDTGTGEWADERAGEAIAQEEQKADDPFANDTPVDANNEFTAPPAFEDSAPPPLGDQFGAPPALGGDQFGGPSGRDDFGGGAQAEPEPEDKTKSYADYLAEQAEKKLQLGGTLTARQANEGAAKNMPEGKQYSREETEYFAGAGPKAARQRERKQKDLMQLDYRNAESAEDTRGGRGGRGGRGRARGDRGDFQGDRGGRGGFRARGDRGGGGFRGDRGGGRGRARGGAGGETSVNVSSAADFPDLGGS